MAEISAAAVMKLRKISGQGMMDCKKALEETSGDLEQAMTLLRKKGLTTLAKRADRETTEGRVRCSADTNGKLAAMATLCCETDFVANSDDFIFAGEALSNYILACPSDNSVEELLKTEVGGKSFTQLITETVSKIGEKIEIGDYARFKLASAGLISTYVHFNGKIGVMVEIETSTQAVADNAAFASIAKDICMHIAAINPLALDSSGISAEIIEREKAIAAEQVKGKPANLIEKIVEGKLKKFFAENCLLSQGFVKDDKTMVEKVLADSAKAAGGTAKIKRFVRFAIG